MNILTKRLRRRLLCLLAVAALAASSGCTTMQKQGGVYRTTAYGFNFFFFTIPRTDFQKVLDRIERDVGSEAQITNIWRTDGPMRPWFNLLNPILGMEIIEVYGTY